MCRLSSRTTTSKLLSRDLASKRQPEAPDAPSDVEEEVAEKERAEITVALDDAVNTPSSSASVQSRP